MATFVCVNDLSSHAGEALNLKNFIEKSASDGQASGLFFYSDSVSEILSLPK